MQGLRHKPDKNVFFFRNKILETNVFLEPFTDRRSHLLLKCLHFVDNEGCDKALAVATPECDISADVCVFDDAGGSFVVEGKHPIETC